MTPVKEFFANIYNNQVFKAAATVLQAQPNLEQNQRLVLLGQTWSIIAANAQEFDELCQINIEWIGDQLLSYAKQISSNLGSADIDIITSLTYRFIIEFDLSIRGELSDELRTFKNVTYRISDTLSSPAREQIQFAHQSMPIAITKRVMNSEEIGSLRKVSSISSSMEEKIKDWDERLTKSEEKVNALRSILSQQEQAFNFVGLHQGFANLESQVSMELTSTRRRLVGFGILLTIPSFIDIAIISMNLGIFQQDNLALLAAAAITSITLTLFFLYFFRITLRAADSCRAQLIQIRLRMTLCAFIQNYAEYSKSIKSENADALAKFESLIFSGLVMNEQNLPSTFDGVEQLAGLAKSIRGN